MSDIRAALAAFGAGIIVVLLATFLSQLHLETESASKMLGEKTKINDQIVAIPYRFSGGDLKIQSIAVQLYWPTITLLVDVRQDGILEVRLPVAVLKQLEVGSNLEYCVGFPLSVNIDGEFFHSEMKVSKNEEILSSQGRFQDNFNPGSFVALLPANL